LEKELQLPGEQHETWRWMMPQSLLATDNVHENSRAYFMSERQAEVPGL